MVGIILYLSIKKTQPISGELSSRKIINLKVTSPVYKNFDDDSPIGPLCTYLSKELEINSSLIIPLRYYAVSENGYFCIHIKGDKFWVNPGNDFNYVVSAKPVKANKSKVLNRSESTTTSKKLNSSSTTSQRTISTSQSDSLTGK